MIETLPVVNSCSECLSSVDRTHKFCYNCGNPLLLGDGTLLLDGTRSDCNINLIVDLQNTDPKPEPEYVTWFTTQHREACRTAAFSPDGKFLATGSKDYSIKILDITKIKECFLEKNDIKPVLKTIYDHQQPVNQIKFHPNGMVLASCADDGFIKFFDLVKPSSKKNFRYFQDSYPVKSIDFHPSGDFLIAGTEHSSVRIYDIHSLQCYIPPQPLPSALQQGHQGGINCVQYSPSGALFATASDDGTVKIWDAVLGRIQCTIQSAHSGSPVTSVKFSKNSRYILTCGQDSTGRLYEVSSQDLIQTYVGTASTRERNLNITMCFSYNEDYVFGSDDSGFGVVCWDTRTGHCLKKFTAHQNVVGYVVASPVENAIISCSEDSRARFWMGEN